MLPVGRSRRIPLLALGLILPCLTAIAPDGVEAAEPVTKAAPSVTIVVVREHGVGSAAHAQKYLDRFITVTAKLNGWAAASGKYHTRRSSAETYIASAKPHFGILSLGAFLALRKKHSMKVIGRVDVAGAGGRQYYIVSKSRTTLDDCSGKTLASDHVDDAKFIDRVVANGDFTLGDFDLVATRRPVQTIKKVTRGEAECALIDDAQHKDLKRVEGGEDLRTVWTSAKLPPMVVVALPEATAAETRRFRANLGRVCAGTGRTACKETGMRALMPASEVEYRAVVRAYGG